ncbi:MAG: hypothetical protein WA790_07185 [Sulfitobacter sp.]
MTLLKPRGRHSDDNVQAALNQISLSEIYRHEVLQSRRDRSRRAFFWARVMGLVLMVTIGATLRSEPELRSAIARAGMDAIVAASGSTQPTQTAALAPDNSTLPKSRVKVNRFGSPAATPDQQLDTQALAQQLGRAMAAQNLSN